MGGRGFFSGHNRAGESHTTWLIVPLATFPYRGEPMKILGWILKNIPTPSSMKRDALLLLILFLFNCFQFSSWATFGQVTTKPWLLLAWLYGLAGLVPLVLRDRAPVAVFAIQCIHTVAALPILHLYTPVVGIPVALYAISVHCSKNTSLLALLASFIPNGLDAIAALWIYDTNASAIKALIANAVFLTFTAIGAHGVGRLVQASRQRVQRLECEQKTAQEAVAEERKRIARELHDTVAHAVTGILLQAAVAIRRTPETNAQLKEPLANIETMGQQAMAELRRLLGVLVRSNSTGHAADIGELGPQPGLADLNPLLAGLKMNGMVVNFDEEGTPRNLDPSVDLAAYRIVREGLNNILKHAGEARNPKLRLAWEVENLIIEIDNGTSLTEASRRQELSLGHGLVSLRERAHAVGGHLYASPHSEVGYRLTATLPFAAPTVPQGVSSTTGLCACSQQPGDRGKLSA
jgi:signal transduction histidine kinase